MYKVIWWICWVWAALPVLANAGEYYVSSRTAPLWEAPSFQANKMGILTQGSKVEAVEERNGWVSVRYDQHHGWMLKLMLSGAAPLQPAADPRAMQVLEERARCRPSAFASTAAARGLMDKEDGFGHKLTLDFKAVERMESWRVTDQQVSDFMTESLKYEKKKK